MSQRGLKMILRVGGVVIGAVKETGVKVNKQPLDASSKSSDGFRKFHDKVGAKSLDFNFSGLMELNAIRALAISPGDDVILQNVALEYEEGQHVHGDFALSGYSESGKDGDLVTCSFDLLSSGPWTLVTPP